MRISFNGYQSVLKTLFREGKLPKGLRGIYGDVLTQNNLSLEHIIPKSKGGRTELCNLALASKRMNTRRGSRPIQYFLSMEMVDSYCKQFEGLQIGKFNGHRYIDMLKQTVSKILGGK